MFNQLLLSIPFIISSHYILMYRGMRELKNLPNFPAVLLQTILCYVMYEINFYFSHRTLHLNMFYKHFHKQHHEWTSSIGVVATYCHPVEHLISNLMSVGVGPIVLNQMLKLGVHVIVIWIWVLILSTSTVIDHSNYHLPFFHSGERHDYHHLKFNVNYGATGWMDHLFGTDHRFNETVNAKRHRTLLSFESAREKFPDPVAKKVHDN